MTRAGKPARVFRWWRGARPHGRISFTATTTRTRVSGPGLRGRGAAVALTSGRGAHLLYVALTCLLALSAWAAWRHGEVRLVRLFAADFATESLGLLVTLALVHRFLERQERALRLRGSLGAVRRSGRALAAMVDAWTDLVKGALVRTPEPRPLELADLLAPDLTSVLMEADPRHPRVRAAVRRLAEAREALRSVVSTYGATLDPVYLGAIDDLTDDPFLGFLAHQAGLQPVTPEHHRAVLRSARSSRVTHFDRLLLAVDYHNQLARDAARLRDRRTAPRGDGYAPSLPLDVDLRVHTEVVPEWWSVAPRAGALRTVRFRDAVVPEADTAAPGAASAVDPKSLPVLELTLSDEAAHGFPLSA